MSLYHPITEASATILYPKSGKESFYNPVQEYNRDLTIAVIEEWSKQFLKERKEKYAKREDPTTPCKQVASFLLPYISVVQK